MTDATERLVEEIETYFLLPDSRSLPASDIQPLGTYLIAQGFGHHEDIARETFEESCRLVCRRCRDGEPVTDDEYFLHSPDSFPSACRAIVIRRYLASLKGENDD